MKLCTFIFTLLAISFLAGCHRSEPGATQNSPEPSTPRSSIAEDAPSANKYISDSPANSLSENEIVQTDVRTNLNAVYKGDVETVLGYTHPKIIEMMGGRTQAKTVLKHTLSRILATGIAVESLAFPEDPTFLKTETNHFVFVPTKSIVIANGQRVESLNYQFGIKAIGTSRWTYIEGSRINKLNVRTMFPDFPSDYDEFPEFYRKKL